MPAWIISLVVNFVLRQIAKFADGTDWVKVKADALSRISQIVPAWLLPSLADIVGEAVDILAEALKSTDDLAAIAAKLVAGDVAGALALVIALVEKLIHLPAQYQVLEALKKCQAHAPATPEAVAESAGA